MSLTSDIMLSSLKANIRWPRSFREVKYRKANGIQFIIHSYKGGAIRNWAAVATANLFRMAMGSLNGTSRPEMLWLYGKRRNGHGL